MITKIKVNHLLFYMQFLPAQLAVVFLFLLSQLFCSSWYWWGIIVHSAVVFHVLQLLPLGFVVCCSCYTVVAVFHGDIDAVLLFILLLFFTLLLLSLGFFLCWSCCRYLCSIIVHSSVVWSVAVVHINAVAILSNPCNSFPCWCWWCSYFYLLQNNYIFYYNIYFNIKSLWIWIGYVQLCIYRCL